MARLLRRNQKPLDCSLPIGERSPHLWRDEQGADERAERFKSDLALDQVAKAARIGRETAWIVNGARLFHRCYFMQKELKRTKGEG